MPATARTGLRVAVLLALVGVGALATRLAKSSWNSVIAYTPPYQIADDDEPGGAPLAERVVLVLVDGLRLDASRDMPVLNRLRSRGADFDSMVAAPSYSRPGRAVLGTGAWSEIHGATSNFHDKALAVDNLFRVAARAGRTCAVAGSLWPSLFGPDLARANAGFLKPPVKDEAGRYDELEPRIRAFGPTGIAFLQERAAQLSVLDLLVTDYAAHEFGGRSDEYRRAVARSDAMLDQLLATIDLGTTAVVVTADHGHLDEGGHGGPEPEVLATPLVLAGEGVKAGVKSEARQIDIAPTIAALLGLPLPGGAQGRVLLEALDVSDEQRVAVLEREWRQKRALARDTLAFLGVADRPDPAAEAPRDPVALMASLETLSDRVAAASEARAQADRRRRLAPFLLTLLLPLPIVVFLLRRASWIDLRAAIAGIVVYALAFRFLVYGRGIRLALSAINHEDDVEPYFLRIAMLATIALALSLIVALALARRSRASFGVLCDLGLSVAGVVVYLLAVTVAALHWREGLFMEWRAADLRWGFLGFVNLVQIQAVGYGAVVAPAMAWVATRFGRGPRLAAAAAIVFFLVPGTAGAAGTILSDVPAKPDAQARYLIFLHRRIVEEQGRDAVSPQHGRYEYDAILGALAERGFVVISELRPSGTGLEYAKKVAGQARKLLAGGVPPESVTIAGFSKGGGLALASAAELGQAKVNVVVLAGCGGPPPAFAPRLRGRILSIFDGADDVAASCDQTFAKSKGIKTREIVLEVGKGHGTFYAPRKEWLDPLADWASRRD
jgi:hypothetical protein